MVHGPAVLVGAPARAHVGAVNGIAMLQRELAHAPNVSRVARSLKAVDSDDDALWLTGGSMRVEENLDTWLGLDARFALWETAEIEPSSCKIPENRQQVRIAHQWLEQVQTTIIGLLVFPARS